MSDKPIGVTIATKGYKGLAEEALDRFVTFTHLPAKIIESEDGFYDKLCLDKLVSRRPIVFFDADWWLLRSWDVKQLCGTSAWVAVNDPMVNHEKCIPFKDCRDAGLNRFRYFNTGFFICDLRNELHRQVFHDARISWQMNQDEEFCHDHTDQYHINLAVEVNRIPLTLLPFQYNFFKFACDLGGFPFIPREIYGLHGAGARRNMKRQMLEQQAEVFGNSVSPMLDDAIKQHHALTFELR